MRGRVDEACKGRGKTCPNANTPEISRTSRRERSNVSAPSGRPTFTDIRSYAAQSDTNGPDESFDVLFGKQNDNGLLEIRISSRGEKLYRDGNNACVQADSANGFKSVRPEQFAGDFLPEFGCCDLQFAVHGWHPCTSQKMGR